MSRIGSIGIDDAEERPRPDGPVLRRRRRRPLHPEEIEKRLRERAARQTASRGPTPYGWLVILYAESGRVVRHTHADATYQDALALLESEKTWTGACDAWIVAKRVPNQRTVLP